MSCLSALCDLYSLYTLIYFLYSISFAYVNVEQNCTQKVYKSKSMFFAPQLFWMQYDAIHFVYKTLTAIC